MHRLCRAYVHIAVAHSSVRCAELVARSRLLPGPGHNTGPGAGGASLTFIVTAQPAVLAQTASLIRVVDFNSGTAADSLSSAIFGSAGDGSATLAVVAQQGRRRRLHQSSLQRIDALGVWAVGTWSQVALVLSLSGTAVFYRNGLEVGRSVTCARRTPLHQSPPTRRVELIRPPAAVAPDGWNTVWPHH